MKLSAILLTVALFVSASVANATPSNQQPGKPNSTPQVAMEDAKDAKDMKEEAPKGNQMAPEAK